MPTASLPLDRLEAVFFDAGNTLVGMDLDLLAERLAAHSLVAPADAIGRAEAAARCELSRHLEGGQSTEHRDTFLLYIRCTLDRLACAQAADRAALAAELAHDLRTTVSTRRLWSRVLPGVPHALERLRTLGLRLVVVSNSDGSIERGLVEMGLAPYFDGVVDSTVVGFEKPDPRIFERALDLSRSAPARTAHVGDIYSVDVRGARAAGLHGVLLDPYDDWQDVDCARYPDVAALAREIARARGASLNDR